MRSKMLQLLKRWWFWLCVILVCAIPTGEWMSATGEHYEFGVPFPSLYVKHGNMGAGTGATLSRGFVFFRDQSRPPPSGVRTGWFLHPDLIGIGLNAGLCLIALYGLTLFRHAKPIG